MSDPYLYQKLAELERRLADLETMEVSATIAVRYQTDAGQSIAHNTETIVDFEDVTFDPDDLVTTGAAWHFTAPIAGVYRVSFALLFASTTAWADGEALAMSLYRNGVSVSVLYRRDNNASAASTFAPLYGTDLVQLGAGDTLDLRVQQASGGALALIASSAFNYIAIERIA